MNKDLIFIPLLVQVFLTLFAYVRLAQRKAAALQAGAVDEARRALHDDAWPDNVLKVNNSIRNQFELPVLFYVLVVVVWMLDAAGAVAQVAAWLFALSRIAHFVVHTGSNYVPVRRRVFMFGVAMVALLAGIAAAALVQGLAR